MCVCVCVCVCVLFPMLLLLTKNLIKKTMLTEIKLTK